MLTCSYGAKHMPSRPLYITMWPDKWPNTFQMWLKIGQWPTVILNSVRALLKVCVDGLAVATSPALHDYLVCSALPNKE